MTSNSQQNLDLSSGPIANPPICSLCGFAILASSGEFGLGGPLRNLCDRCMESAESGFENDSLIPSRPTNHQALSNCPLFDGSEPAILERLSAVSFMAYAEAGESIWTEEAIAEFCGVVATGYIRMTKSTVRGSGVTVELVGPRQLFGLLPAMERSPVPFSATAATNAWYLKIPSTEIASLYESSSSFKGQVVRDLGSCQSRNLESLQKLSSPNPEERIIATIKILASLRGVASPSPSTGIEFDSVPEIARVTPDIADRVLREWQSQGLLSVEKGMITALNPDYGVCVDHETTNN